MSILNLQYIPSIKAFIYGNYHITFHARMGYGRDYQYVYEEWCATPIEYSDGHEPFDESTLEAVIVRITVRTIELNLRKQLSGYD